MNNKSIPTDLKNHMLWDQWYDTFAITSITVLAMRQLYIFLFPEEYPRCPWQKAVMSGIFAGILQFFYLNNYLIKYVQLDKI